MASPWPRPARGDGVVELQRHDHADRPGVADETEQRPGGVEGRARAGDVGDDDVAGRQPVKLEAGAMRRSAKAASKVGKRLQAKAKRTESEAKDILAKAKKASKKNAQSTRG